MHVIGLLQYQSILHEDNSVEQTINFVKNAKTDIQLHLGITN